MAGHFLPVLLMNRTFGRILEWLGFLKDHRVPTSLPGGSTESKQGEVREGQVAGMRYTVEGMRVGKATVTNHT